MATRKTIKVKTSKKKPRMVENALLIDLTQETSDFRLQNSTATADSFDCNDMFVQMVLRCRLFSRWFNEFLRKTYEKIEIYLFEFLLVLLLYFIFIYLAFNYYVDRIRNHSTRFSLLWLNAF